MLRFAGTIAGAFLVALAAAVMPTAGPAQAERPSTPTVMFADGVIHWSITASDRTAPIWPRRSRPCLMLGTTGGTRHRACVIDRHHAEVTRSDGTRFRIPVTAQRKRTGWQIELRQADWAPAPGPSDAWTRCRDAACDRSRESVVVPRLHLTSCRPGKPWLVHEGAPGIGRAVSLTFDDGPGPITRKVMRVLRAYGAAATFFQVGEMVERDPGVLKRMVRAGHAIGNHSYTHPVLGGDDRRELTRTNRSIVRAGAPRPCVFRAPYGENPPEVVRMARDLGMVTVNWNTDPGDWRGLTADQIVAATLSQTRPGSIMVFHDGGDHQATVQALPRILAALQARGYRFLTIPELLRLPTSYR